MKSALKMAACTAALIVAAPAAALAQNAIMIDDAAMRAGPGSDFPRVAYIPEGARVNLRGCVRGFSWCDISWRGDRGWVNASNIGYRWNDRRVIVNEWGPRIGLPIISFSVQDYWSRHYRQRPWWSQRNTWFERERDRRDDRSRGRDRWDRDDRQRRDRDDWRDRQRGDRDGSSDRRSGPREDGRGAPRSEWRGRQDRGDDRQPRQESQSPQRDDRGGMRSGQGATRPDGRSSGQTRGRDD